MGRAEDVHPPIEHFEVGPALGGGAAGHAHPAVAHTAHDVAAALAVKLFVAGDVLRPLPEIPLHLRPKGVDAVLVGPDVEVVQGDAAVVELAQDGRVVPLQAGVIQQQAAHPVGHAAVLAVGVLEQRRRKLFQAGRVLGGEVGGFAGEERFVQQGVVLLHQGVGGLGALLDEAQYLRALAALGEVGPGKAAHFAQVFNVSLTARVHPARLLFSQTLFILQINYFLL